MSETMDRVMAMADDAYVPRSVVAQLCEACAEKMKAKGIKAIRASVIKKAFKASRKESQSQVPKLELTELKAEKKAMNRIAVAKELVAIAKLITGIQYDDIIEGKEFRLSMRHRGDFLLEEMPQKGMKRCRIWLGHIAPWIPGFSEQALVHINLPNVVRGVHTSMSFDQVKDSMLKAMDTLAEEAKEKSEAAGGKSYTVKDLFGHWENQVHFLQVEPTDSKPFIAEGKDFKVDVSWTGYKAYDPSSDFQQADPHYTLYKETSAAAGRKLYKILKANPDALKAMSWGGFKNWLDKNGIGCDVQFSVWH